MVFENQPMQAMCRKCFAPLAERASVCAQCGAPVEDPTPAPISDVQPSMAAIHSDSDLRARGGSGSGVRSDLSGIGGWLILVAIALLSSPIGDVYRIYSDLNTLYGGGLGQVLSDHPGATNLMVTQIVADAIFFICLLALNYLFYRKNKMFPRMMIVYLFVHTIYILFRSHASDVLLGTHVFAASAASATAGASIWISYLVSSKRVKATFLD
jgi:hypothetical protein